MISFYSKHLYALKQNRKVKYSTFELKCNTILKKFTFLKNKIKLHIEIKMYNDKK